MTSPDPLAICALCTAEIPAGKGVRLPLGRNDALVNVCDPCDAEHPRSGRYAFNESPGKTEALNSINGKSGNRRSRARY